MVIPHWTLHEGIHTLKAFKVSIYLLLVINLLTSVIKLCGDNMLLEPYSLGLLPGDRIWTVENYESSLHFYL